MGKLIFWLVVFFAVLFVLRLINVANSRTRNRSAPKKPAAGAMIQCVNCGVYLPSGDAKQGERGPLCGDPQCVKRREEAPR